MDLLSNSKFMITTTYGVLGMALYTGVTAVVISDKKKLQSSFFSLFCVGYFMNLCTYMNSFITLRLPQNTGINGTLSRFFASHPENRVDSSFPLFIFHSFHFEFAYTQYIFNCLIGVNRFTAIFYPMSSEKNWLRYWGVLVLLMFAVPVFFIRGILFNHSFYRYSASSNSFSTDTTYGRSNIYAYLMPSLITLTSINIILNVASCVKLYQMKKKGISVPETSLFLMAFCVFIIDLFLTILSVLNYYLSTGLISGSEFTKFLGVWIPILTPFASDALTLTHPILLLIFSKTVRRSCIEHNMFLKRYRTHRFFANSNSVVVLVSQQKMNNTTQQKAASSSLARRN